MSQNWAGSHSTGFPTRTRARILRRDPWCLCPGCANHAGPCVARSTIADHIVPRSEGGTDHPTNGQGLCDPCHRHKTAAEAERGKARKSPRRRPEAHPGLTEP